MKESDRWDQIFDLLSDPYRRELLTALLESNPQDDDDIDPLDLGDNDDLLEIDLVHRHLPKLEELGVIEWDRDTHEIKKGPEWDAIAPLIELIHDHRDELPEGWL